MAVQYLIDMGEFRDRIGVLFAEELAPFGIIPDTMIGNFFDGQPILDACKVHPHLHPITWIDDTMFNCFIPGPYMYCLGNGDADPTLKFTRKFLTTVEYGEVLDRFLLENRGEPLDKYNQLALNVLTACATGGDPADPRTLTQFLDKKYKSA